jgi:hypothetical protein
VAISSATHPRSTQLIEKDAFYGNFSGNGRLNRHLSKAGANCETTPNDVKNQILPFM